MTKQAINNLLTEKYHSFISFINGLTTEEYSFGYQQKWTAGQQLEHIVLCVKPLVQVFSMDKLMIEQNFGLADKPSRSYEMLLESYLEKLKEGGKAPDRFVPDTSNQKDVLIEGLTQLIKILCSKIENFTEQELDSFCIPHPLLDSLTMREMLYNAIYHVEHHQKLAEENLKYR